MPTMRYNFLASKHWSRQLTRPIGPSLQSKSSSRSTHVGDGKETSFVIARNVPTVILQASARPSVLFCRLRILFAAVLSSSAVSTAHAADLRISFGNDVVPTLTKAGCNTGVCHGKAGGQHG